MTASPWYGRHGWQGIKMNTEDQSWICFINFSLLSFLSSSQPLLVRVSERAWRSWARRGPSTRPKRRSWGMWSRRERRSWKTSGCCCSGSRTRALCSNACCSTTRRSRRCRRRRGPSSFARRESWVSWSTWKPWSTVSASSALLYVHGDRKDC